MCLCVYVMLSKGQKAQKQAVSTTFGSFQYSMIQFIMSFPIAMTLSLSITLKEDLHRKLGVFIFPIATSHRENH